MGLKNLFSRKRVIKRDYNNVSLNETLELRKSLERLNNRLNDMESHCQNAKSADAIQRLKVALENAKNCRFRSFSDCQSILNLVDRELNNLSFILNNDNSYISQQVSFIIRLLNDFQFGKSIYLENKDNFNMLAQRSEVYNCLARNNAELDIKKQEHQQVAKELLDAYEKKNNRKIVSKRKLLRTIEDDITTKNALIESLEKSLEGFNKKVDSDLEKESVREQSELDDNTAKKIVKNMEEIDKITYQTGKEKEKARDAILKNRTRIMDRYTSDDNSLSSAMNEAVEQSKIYGEIQAQKDNSLLDDDISSDIDLDMLKRIANGEDE